MPIVRVSKEVWKLVMLESIETEQSASVIIDRLLAEVVKDAKENARTIQRRDKKRSDGGVEGVIDLID